MQTNSWSLAAVNGLLLALVTIILTLVQTVLEPGTAIKVLIWIAKLVGSLWLLYYFIKDYAKDSEVFTYKMGFNYGFKVCLLSSLVCAIYMFMHFAVIFPEAVQASLEQAAAMMQSSNPDAVDAINRISGKLPQIVTITVLVYYTLFGIVASAIIANFTKKGDIFASQS